MSANDSKWCMNCKFFCLRSDNAKDHGGGVCRRYPPHFEVREALNDGWPNVQFMSWCGEHQPKDPTP